MLIKHHDHEAYYLQRRLELLQILDGFANDVLFNGEEELNDNHPKIQLLSKEYSDVIDPESLCQTIKRIYPDHLYSIESRLSSASPN